MIRKHLFTAWVSIRSRDSDNVKTADRSTRVVGVQKQVQAIPVQYLRGHWAGYRFGKARYGDQRQLETLHHISKLEATNKRSFLYNRVYEFFKLSIMSRECQSFQASARRRHSTVQSWMFFYLFIRTFQSHAQSQPAGHLPHPSTSPQPPPTCTMQVQVHPNPWRHIC
jgi:hypothetical protein